MANTTSVTRIGACANNLCPNEFPEGQFSVVTIRTGKNVGNGSGLIQMIMCTPCANAFTADETPAAQTVAAAEPAEVTKLRLAPAEPAPASVQAVAGQLGDDPDF